MKRRVVLTLSVLLAASVLMVKEQPANAFKLWSWHKAKVEVQTPAVQVTTPQVQIPKVQTPKVEVKVETPVANVKTTPVVKKEIVVVNKKPCPKHKPCPLKKHK